MHDTRTLARTNTQKETKIQRASERRDTPPAHLFDEMLMNELQQLFFVVDYFRLSDGVGFPNPIDRRVDVRRLRLTWLSQSMISIIIITTKL